MGQNIDKDKCLNGTVSIGKVTVTECCWEMTSGTRGGVRARGCGAVQAR